MFNLFRNSFLYQILISLHMVDVHNTGHMVEQNQWVQLGEWISPQSLNQKIQVHFDKLKVTQIQSINLPQEHIEEKLLSYWALLVTFKLNCESFLGPMERQDLEWLVEILLAVLSCNNETYTVSCFYRYCSSTFYIIQNATCCSSGDTLHTAEKRFTISCE